MFSLDRYVILNVVHARRQLHVDALSDTLMRVLVLVSEHLNDHLLLFVFHLLFSLLLQILHIEKWWDVPGKPGDQILPLLLVEGPDRFAVTVANVYYGFHGSQLTQLHAVPLIHELT